MTRLYTGRPHRDRATFVYAGQDRQHRFVGKATPSVRGGKLPPWLRSLADLDFLDPSNPLWHTDRALFSMGQYLHGDVPSGMFSPRPGATILGDSGGFQLLEDPSLWRGDATRQWVLTALEHHTDEAMTLDVPTRGVRPATPWPTFAAALQITVDNLRFFDRHRVGKTRMLNVLQGETRADWSAWYAAVKWFPAGGWAFGGKMRENMAFLADRLCVIADEGLLAGKRNRVHVLGMADLTAAVALSAIQRGLRKRTGDDDLLITFDVSSPSLMSGKARQAYGLPRFSPSDFGSTYFHPQVVVRPERKDVPFAVQNTAIGSRMRMGDLCVIKPGSIARTAWDDLSEELLVSHNTEALLAAIDMANSVMELHPVDAAQLAPGWVINACQMLEGACRAKNPMSYLSPALVDVRRL